MSDGFRLARPGAIGRGRKSSEIDESLPQAIWDALNIARENKALFVAKGGAIVNVNELAAQLCDRTPEELLGGCFISQFLQCSQTRQPAATMRRWRTDSGRSNPRATAYGSARARGLRNPGFARTTRGGGANRRFQCTPPAATRLAESAGTATAGPECPIGRGIEQHRTRACHVRCRPAACPLQSPLCGNI